VQSDSIQILQKSGWVWVAGSGICPSLISNKLQVGSGGPKIACTLDSI